MSSHPLPSLLTRRRAPRASRKTSSAPSLPHSPALLSYYHTLLRAFGPQSWWPGRTRFEVIVGAILTQNTSWLNVERALRNLRRNRLLTPAAIEAIPLDELANLIRSSGYFRQKARKLKAFVTFLREHHHGSLNHLFRTPLETLRPQLLAIHGIGPETADCILLYAGRYPSFVIDAYTRRILSRHQLASGAESYDHLRDLFHRSLPADPQLFNEYHALIVRIAKHHCMARSPICSTCPLRPFLLAPIAGAR